MKTWTPEAIKEFRASYNLSQPALGRLTGVSGNYIYLMERGDRKPSKTLMLLLDRIEKDLLAKRRKQMPKQIIDVDVLRDYLRGVMDRADHHAKNVNEVALAIAGGVIWRKDDDPLEIMVQEGEMKNVLWFRVEGRRYALSFNHESKEIELRQGTTQGSVMASFSNAMSNDEVRRIFSSL